MKFINNCFLGGDDATAKFSIANTGVITKTADAFDTTVKKYYELVVTCNDAAGTASTTLTICLDSLDNCPSKASLSTGIFNIFTIPALIILHQLI